MGNAKATEESRRQVLKDVRPFFLLFSFFHSSSSDKDMTNLECRSCSYSQKGAKLHPPSLPGQTLAIQGRA